jgi:hypothetical protein
MKHLFGLSLLSLFFVACQPPAENAPEVDNSGQEAFERNSKTVMAFLEGYQNENLDYNSIYSENVILRLTHFGSKDSLDLEGMMKNDAQGWANHDFELLADPVVLLPGVNTETKMVDGSVRYYGDWMVTRSATDSTEAKSGIVRLYESFDFDEEGKIIYQQYYGDLTGLNMYLRSE